MKKFLRSLLLQFVYFTPLGLIFSAAKFESGETGISIDLGTKTPIRAYVSKNPPVKMRLQWFFDGTISIISAILIIRSQYGGDIGAVYAVLALQYGGLCVVSSLQPKNDWNKRGSIIPLTLFETLVIVTFVGVPYFYLNSP